MTNEDIIYTLERFVHWGNEDKKKVIESLSADAINNLTNCLTLSSSYKNMLEFERLIIERDAIFRKDWENV